MKPVAIVLGEADTEFAAALSEAMSGTDHARLKDRRPVIGSGLYLWTCDECGQEFRTEDRWQRQCPPCEAEEPAQPQEAPTSETYHYSEFRRGRRA